VVSEDVAGSDPDCTHHWLLATPNGETSRGVCKYCGAIRHFKNSEDPPSLRRGAPPRNAPQRA
jgi:hypothetical protein